MNSPFNEAKYKALLEGLEISIIKLSQLERTWRLDSEFYQKENLSINKLIEQKKYLPLTDLVSVSDGNHMKISNYFSDEGVPYYRGQDIHHFFIEQSEPKLITKEAFDIPYMKRSHLEKGDVLLSIVGTIGKLSLVNKAFKATCSCKLAILRPKTIHPEFLATFLASRYGKNQTRKFTRGAIQMGLILEDMNQLKVPSLTIDFQNLVKKMVSTAYEHLKNSKNQYKTAETLLLSELGLENYTPSTKNTQQTSLQNSFVVSGRLDAEYNMPKYIELEEKLKRYKSIKIKDLVKYPVSSGATPKAGSDYYTDSINGIPFIRAVDLKNGEVKTDKFIYVIPEVHNRKLKKTKLKNKDVLFSIAGTVGRCALFNHKFEANINQALSIIRFEEDIIKRLYFICYFNSFIGKTYISKYSRQGLQTNLTLLEVGNLAVPILSMSSQEIICKQIELSFHFEEKSKQLLEMAKRAVEKAVEENEEEATRWISDQLKKLNISLE